MKNIRNLNIIYLLLHLLLLFTLIVKYEWFVVFVTICVCLSPTVYANKA